MSADNKSDPSSTAQPPPKAGQGKTKSRAQNQKDILDRFDSMVGPLPYDVRKALYFHICAAISEELMETGTAFMPTLGWLTVNTIPKDNGKLEVRPSFKVSRELKDEIKQQVRDAMERGEYPVGPVGENEDSGNDD
jgi:hypothetical protein|tara:strand:- start:24330 stop:24737 length:408 start_codon:yes stop_codon:yes gene_type:complete